MNNHYLLQRISYPRDYHSIKPYKLNRQNSLYTVMAASDCLLIHRVLPDGLVLQATYQFFAKIAKIEVLPSHFNSSDYIWLLDVKGRYAFWTPDQGFEQAHNQPIHDPLPQSYQSILNQYSSEIFTGVDSFCEQNESKGQVFFAIGPKITILQYFISKQGMFMNESFSSTYSQNYKEIRFIGWIKHSNPDVGLLGIVIEKEDGETALEVYEVGRGERAGDWKLGWTVQKKNILQFYSPAKNEVLLLTYDQIALYKYKQGAICCYRTGGNYGQGFFLSNGLYGQIGKQLILFSKEKLIPFNTYHFPEQSVFQEGGLLQCVRLGEIEGVGNVLCVLTHRSEIYFLIISGNQYKIRKLNEGLPIVQSFKALPDLKNEYAIVGRSKQQEYNIFLSERIQSAKTLQFQQTSLKIDNLYSAVRGSYLILSFGSSNFVARLTKNNDYSIYFQLPDQQIIALYEDILVTAEGIYQIDYQTQNYYKYVETQIVLAQIIHQVVYFLDELGNIWKWNLQSKAKRKIIDCCQSDYCWGLSQTLQMLICANLQNMTSLRLVTEEGIKSISIKGHTIISSLATIAPPRKRIFSKLGQNIQQQILIGYCDGTIHVQSVDGHISKVFKLRKVERIIFEAMSTSQILVICPFRQYLLNASSESIKLTDIQLVQSSTHIQHLVYLQKTKTILVVVKDKLKSTKSQILQLCLSASPNYISNFTRLPQNFKSLPHILTSQHTIFFAQPTSIGKIDLTSYKTHFNAHQLVHLSGFQQIELGMLLCGTHSTEKQMVIVWSQSLQIVFRCFFTFNQAIRCIKPIQGTNSFMIWSDSSVTFHELQPKDGRMKLMFGSKVPSKGLQSDLCQQNQLFALNDCGQFLSLYSYDGKVNLNSNYVGSCQIIGCSFLNEDLVLFDQRNQITLFSCERQSNKYVLNRQWSLNLSQMVVGCSKQNNKLYLITENLQIHCIMEIQKQNYKYLKVYEQENLNKQQHRFSYKQWRCPLKSDKLIDCSLLRIKPSQPTASNNKEQIELVQLLQNLMEG